TFKALGDPTRVRLLSLIAAHNDGEACICDLIEPVGLAQPTVSHHMKQLADAGLVTREQRGKWAYYRIVNDALTSLAAATTPGATNTTSRSLAVPHAPPPPRPDPGDQDPARRTGPSRHPPGLGSGQPHAHHRQHHRRYALDAARLDGIRLKPTTAQAGQPSR